MARRRKKMVDKAHGMIPYYGNPNKDYGWTDPVTGTSTAPRQPTEMEGGGGFSEGNIRDTGSYSTGMGINEQTGQPWDKATRDRVNAGGSEQMPTEGSVDPGYSIPGMSSSPSSPSTPASDGGLGWLGNAAPSAAPSSGGGVSTTSDGAITIDVADDEEVEFQDENGRTIAEEDFVAIINGEDDWE